MNAFYTTPNPTPAGVYVHWPFCERKCPYCDFYTLGREHSLAGLRGRFVKALAAEIGSFQARTHIGEPLRADTFYFGGGTPSLMCAGEFQSIIDALKNVFEFNPGAEITLELNPTTAEAAEIDRFLEAGVNRVSVGCQSFDDAVLKTLGRVHDAAATRRAIEKLRTAGVANLSVDIIFAAPGQTAGALGRDINAMLAFAPEHISAYNLTLHEGTPMERWAREGRIAPPGEAGQAAMYEMLIERLGSAGYEHYETSNWARPGFQSRHNSKYWRDCDVYAFGPSAHGTIGARRYENPADLEAYISDGPSQWMRPCDPPEGERARLGEIVMLALRRVGGVGWDELGKWAGRDLREFYAPELARLFADGLLENPAGGLKLTRRGLLLADRVALEFF